MATDLDALKRRAGDAYEAGRRQRALTLALPFFSVGVLAALLGPHRIVGLAVGAGIAALAFASFLVGRAWERSVLPGTLAGLVPFVLAQSTRLFSHGCVHGRCMSWCVPACVAGGVIAGLAVVLWAHRRAEPPTTLISAAGFSLLTGALGCTCVGYSGVIGLLAGLVATSGLTWLGTRILARP